ncbi:metal-dependent hydrolase [Lactobacillus selangorensis]|uniref:Metal-dependent hydrolase n=1 Tax=Lactobacillus selangorensis TaxID=81857 RepID=A0A0R2FU93_9LACO|nr:MBL fold metallo-hydrolase [Lactobacillus selangorensis]KRN28436.1 metal-dependent hydrolase [Lactobacillus selangorensis]KRN31937.1 metal-dependent hydrolase [Lactobacillus selangorensis]
MKVTVLGYLGGYPADNIGTSAYLLESGSYHLLLDCGSGALLNLQHVLDPLQLDAVILSHYHHDHTADVGVLQYYWQLRQGDKKEPVLPIYGSSQDPLNFASLTMQGITQGKAYDPDATLQLGPFKINFLRTVHPVPAYAMRIEEQETGKTLVFTADTAFFDGLVPFSKYADLLMADTNFLADKPGKIWHMTSAQSGELARRAQVGKLLLTHLPQQLDLQVLLDQARTAAGNVPTKLASLGQTIQV